MDNPININNTKNLDDLGLTLQFDKFRNAIDSALFDNAKANDPNALFQIGQTALHYNRMGFAWLFCKLAAKNGHDKAKKCLAFLEDRKLSIALRRQKCLEYIN